MYSNKLDTTPISILIGTWFLDPATRNDTLGFNKKSFYPNNWGPRIEFIQNGRFVDANSEKCGNDNTIHFDTGYWHFVKQANVLNTSIDINLNMGKEFNIISIDSLNLFLRRIKH